MLKSYKLFGVIGFPIKHSLSPYMHNGAFNKLKIKAAYLPFEVNKSKLKEAITALKRGGISGFNVTIPFKTECMRYLDKVDPAAKNIGAVNTVVSTKGKLKGYNTDCSGFIKSLKEELKCNPKGKKILIIGSGGAAKAIAFGLAKEGAELIYTYDIVRAKSNELAKGLKKRFKASSAKVLSKRGIADAISDCALLVNCTPLGMHKNDPLPIDPKLLHKGLKVYDVVYTPQVTKLVSAARRKKIKAIGGIGMLLYQGVLGFELWTKKKAPVSLMRKILLEQLR